MKRIIHALCLLFVGTHLLSAQSGCPGCAISLPANLPTDTLYLPGLPQGEKAKPYDEDVSFRMPKTTTPVHAVDSTTPAGLTISKMVIVGIDNMPPGLHWEASQLVYQTASETDGCIKICGTPTKADTFILLVRLKATVLIFDQDASFPMRLIVAPQSSTNDGFTVSNIESCGELTTSFANNHPSGGHPGFEYTWDFGDNTTFSGENPPMHTYTQPGAYPITYHAFIDTAGYTLESITVLEADCVDQLGLGAPDLYVWIKDASGTLVFNSQPDIANTELPHTFASNLQLGSGNYVLEVWDEDSGLKGTDDPCGNVSFNYLSGDTIISGGFKAILNITHPITEVISMDTVHVYPQPVQPIVLLPTGTETCAGSDSLTLGSNYGAGNQWLINGEIIQDEHDFIYQPSQSGTYQILITGSHGCTAVSAPAQIVFHPLPALPYFINYNNRLQLFDSTLLPQPYALQWYQYAAILPGETGFYYCSLASGEYTLEVTDLTTGCKNKFTNTMVLNPAFDCTTGTSSVLADGHLSISPNPATDKVRIAFDYIRPVGGRAAVRLWSSTGAMLQQWDIAAGENEISMDCTAFPAGVYWIEVVKSGFRQVEKLVLVARE